MSNDAEDTRLFLGIDVMIVSGPPTKKPVIIFTPSDSKSSLPPSLKQSVFQIRW